MPEPTGATEFTGPYGSATKCPVDEQPDSAETVCHWLITAPAFHPAWSQYLLIGVRLRDGVPGFPPPNRQFPGATHEILCVSLNPEHGPYHAESLSDQCRAAGGKHMLTPVNVAHQIEGTDDEADKLCELAAWGICHGALEPEASNGPARIRAGWKTTLVKTLAHVRGEVHAS